MKAKICLLTIFASILLLNLTGCAVLGIHKERDAACLNSKLLYVDLLKPISERKYSLPSGEECPIFNEKNYV